jgi:hypothetical protein
VDGDILNVSIYQNNLQPTGIGVNTYSDLQILSGIPTKQRSLSLLAG